ncbi:unnamed protein product [Prunus armeniaca]
MTFPKFWTQSDIDSSVKLDDSDFTQNTPNDSSHHIMMLPQFWTQSDIDCSVKLDDSGSYDVRSQMEGLVYCIVLSIGFHSKHTKRLLPPYYDVPQFYPSFFTQNTPNDSSHHTVMFPKFWTQSDIDWSVKLHDSGSYDVRSEMEWLFYPLDFTQNTPNDSSHHIMMFSKFWIQSDIDWSVNMDDSGSYDVRTMFVPKWSGWCIAYFYPLDFTQNTPNDSSHHIMTFPKFWTQSDIDSSVKLDDSGSYDVRSEVEWLFWTQSDIDWSVKLDDSGSYDVRSEMEGLFYPSFFTQNTPNDSSHHIVMFPKFWTQSDIDWSVKLHDSGSYDVLLKWSGCCVA